MKMMKNSRYILTFAVLSCMYVSCKVNDIELYSGSPRIEFGETVLNYDFDDGEYLEAYVTGGSQYSQTHFTAQLIGYLLDSPMTFTVTSLPWDGQAVSAFVPEAEFSNPYTFPEGVPSYSADFRIKCPSKEYASTRTTVNTGRLDIRYDVSSPDHQFGEGRVENLSCRLDVTLQIYPTDWNSQFWGMYSTSKYFLMMECFGALHGDIERTTENKLRIIRYYNEYKATHGALYGDDDDSSTEIAFPV